MESTEKSNSEVLTNEEYRRQAALALYNVMKPIHEGLAAVRKKWIEEYGLPEKDANEVMNEAVNDFGRKMFYSK